MKKLIPLFIGIITILLISCHKDEIVTGKQTGSLTIDIGLIINEYELNNGLKATDAIDDFKVIVRSAAGAEVLVYQTASEMPDTIELLPGSYYVEAHSDNNLPAAFENPYYYGVSGVFTINSNMQQSVQVRCGLANTIVSVVYSENTISSFPDVSTTVSSLLDSLVFTMNETRFGYFQPSPLNIRVVLTAINPDGSEITKTLSGAITNPLPGRHYEIVVNTTVNTGKATFQLFMDETEIPVEPVEITDVIAIPQDSSVIYGDLLITEIMFDPSALTDATGEWFEIYNNSDKVINLQNLVIQRDAINTHTIPAPIELLPGGYFVLARTALATETINSYVFGTAISLPNTGATLSIYNPDTGTGPGTLIFSVDYGADNFPALAGASIALNPNLLNTSDAIWGTSWCTSGSVYYTGDFGTPGTVNDQCL